MAIVFTITDAGRAALVDPDNNGTNAVVIAEVGLGSGRYAPTKDQTELQSPIKRLDTIAGQAVSDDTLHVTVQDETGDIYQVGEIGLFTDAGVLFAVYSQSDWIIEKAAPATLLLATDLVVESLDVSSITFGDAAFLNPPASTTVKGVLELATQEEVDAGKDGRRGVVPRTLKSFIDKVLKAYATVRQLTDHAASRDHPAANTSNQGMVELATYAETREGKDNSRAVTPAGLNSLTATTTRAGLVERATNAEALAGTDDVMPSAAQLHLAFNQYGLGTAVPVWPTSSLLDCDGVQTGFYFANGTHADKPGAAYGIIIHTVTTPTTFAHQLFISGYGANQGSTVWSRQVGLGSNSGVSSGWGKYWSDKNQGSGSGLDADLLDGQHGSDYRDASKLNAGTVPAARLSGSYDIDVGGNAATVGGLKVGQFMRGDTGNDVLRFNNKEGGDYTNDGTVIFDHSHGLFLYMTSPPIGGEGAYSIMTAATTEAGANIEITGGKGKDSIPKIAVKQGSGSKLDADMLDGVHASSFLRQDETDYLHADLHIANDGRIIVDRNGGLRIAGFGSDARHYIQGPNENGDDIFRITRLGDRDYEISMGYGGDFSELWHAKNLDPIRSGASDQTVGGGFNVSGSKLYFGNREHNLFDNDGAGNAGLQFGMDKDKSTATGAAVEFQADIDNTDNGAWRISLDSRKRSKGDSITFDQELVGHRGGLEWNGNRIWHEGEVVSQGGKSSGRRKLPNGDTEMWGYVTTATSEGSPTGVTFPYSFDSACHNVQITAVVNPNVDVILGVNDSPSRTGFTAYASRQSETSDSSVPGFFWRAIGR